MSQAPTHIDTVHADHQHLVVNFQLSAYLHDPSKLHSTKDETWWWLPEWVTLRTPMAWGVSMALPLLHLLLCPRNPFQPLDNEPFWGLCMDQHSHLTPGLTLYLVGVERR